MSNVNNLGNMNSINNLENVWSVNPADSLGATSLFFASQPDNNNIFSERFEQLPSTVSDEPIENKFGAIGSNVPTPPSASDGSNPCTQSSSSSSPFSLMGGLNGNNSPPDQMWLGAIGNNLGLNSTPQINSSPESGNIPIVRTIGLFQCGYCRNDAQYYCNSCNEGMCGICIQPHFSQPNLKQHRMQKMRSPSPKPWFMNQPTRLPQEASGGDDRECALHFETLAFICENCKVIVCQGCTLRDHYEHKCSTIEEYIKNPNIVIKALLDKSDVGKQEIKRMIDRVVVYTSYLERDMNDIALTRRRNPRSSNGMLTPQQAEDQEIYVTEILEKFRTAHQTMFTDKTSGLRSALAGIASVTDELRRRGAFKGMDSFTLAKALIEHDNKIEHHLKQYSKMAPTQVDVCDFYHRLMSQFDDPQTSLEQLANNLNGVNAWNVDVQTLINNTNQLNLNGRDRDRERERERERERDRDRERDRLPRRAIVARNHQQNHSIQSFFTQVNQQNQFWNTHTVQALQTAQANKLAQLNKLAQSAQLHSVHNLHMQNDFANQLNLNVNDMFMLAASQPMLQSSHLRSIQKDDKYEPNPGFGQCIYNLGVKVSVNHRFVPTCAFAGDGCEEGQLSRPWGVCVDKFGQIIIGDRRNNRIQIFGANGEFKFAFGTKGTGDGELDLPAGVTVDIQNRIIVADKDNHRVQIFSAIGRFVLKFGSYGRGLGEFQYPWDVASNSAGHIVVSDTRNHRVQMFSAYGHFITKFSFDDIPGPSGLKTNITPRGISYDCNGDILVTDFENHRIMKLDGNLRRVSINHKKTTKMAVKPNCLIELFVGILRF